MKISIHGAEPFGDHSSTILFNTVKRFQEDLISRLPQLKEFNLKIKPQIASGFHYENISYRHLVDDAESRLELVCYYRNIPHIGVLEKDMTGKLKEMIQFYS